MKFRKLDDLSISEVGLGTWQLGADWGEVADNDAQAILDTAVESGITFFDTADIYGSGLSEKRIREFVTRTGSDITIATKMGRCSDPGWPGNFTLANMEKQVEASLERLGADALDLTQLHCIPTDLLAENDVFESLRKIKASGKIKRFGASVESMEEADFCLEQEGLTSLQIIFNIYRQKPVEFLFEKAKKKNIALIVRLPLASGMLSGRFSRSTVFAKEDHRNYNKDGECFNVGETFAGIPFEKGLELTARLKEIVPQDVPLSELALRWILDFEEVSVVIPGATRTSQVASNARASDLPPLSEELHQKLRDFYTQEVTQHIRGVY